jgi:hypothetical protein
MILGFIHDMTPSHRGSGKTLYPFPLGLDLRQIQLDLEIHARTI